MRNTNKTSIDETNKFDSADYPAMVKELMIVKSHTAHLPAYYKSEIVISYFKDHSLKVEWIETNPKLAQMVTGEILKCSNIELLFTSSRQNKSFLKDYENYIKNQVT